MPQKRGSSAPLWCWSGFRGQASAASALMRIDRAGTLRFLPGRHRRGREPTKARYPACRRVFLLLSRRVLRRVVSFFFGGVVDHQLQYVLHPISSSSAAACFLKTLADPYSTSSMPYVSYFIVSLYEYVSYFPINIVSSISYSTPVYIRAGEVTVRAGSTITGSVLVRCCNHLGSEVGTKV